MDWSDVKIFLAVARAGSLGGAARLTGQSPVSYTHLTLPTILLV